MEFAAAAPVTLRPAEEDERRKSPANGVVQAIHHVQLAMPPGREAEAEACYSGVIGIPRVTKPPELEKRGGCWFRSSGVEIHLGVEEPFVPARKAHPALLVDSVEALRHRLEAASLEATADADLPGFHRLYATDPFGNRLEFLQARQDPDHSNP